MTTVFLHPIGLDRDCWQFLDADVLRGARLHTFPWHGGRPRPSVEPSLHLFAGDVLEQVSGPLDLIGLSMGGAVAQHLAINYPERVRSLLVACSSPGGGDGTMHEQRAIAALASGMSGVTEPTLTRWFTQAAMAQAGHPGVGYARDRLLADEAESFAASWRALGRNNSRPGLPTVRAPATVVHALSDESGRREVKEEMVRLLPVARLVVMAGPHMVQLERPAEFSEVVREHVAWVTEQAG